MKRLIRALSRPLSLLGFGFASPQPAQNTPCETPASRPAIAIVGCAQDRVSSAPLAEAITATLFAGRVCVPRARHGLLSHGCVLEPLPVVAPAPQASEMGPERPEAYGRRHSAMETLSDRVPRAPNPPPNNPATPFIYLQFEMATIHPVCSELARRRGTQRGMH